MRCVCVCTRALHCDSFLCLQDKTAAETKNRGIYYDMEPTPNQLAAISPLQVAKVKPFDAPTEMEGIVDYFAEFVPPAVSDAVDEFAQLVCTVSRLVVLPPHHSVSVLVHECLMEEFVSPTGTSV